LTLESVDDVHRQETQETTAGLSPTCGTSAYQICILFWMVDIQFATAENRRGENEGRRRKKTKLQGDNRTACPFGSAINTSILTAPYTMLARLVESYFTVLRWNPVMLMAEDICGRWLGLCRYAEYRLRSSPLSPDCAVTDETEPKMRPRPCWAAFMPTGPGFPGPGRVLS